MATVRTLREMAKTVDPVGVYQIFERSNALGHQIKLTSVSRGWVSRSRTGREPIAVKFPTEWGTAGGGPWWPWPVVLDWLIETGKLDEAARRLSLEWYGSGGLRVSDIGVKEPTQDHRPDPTDRNADILAAVMAGRPYRDIADEYGVTFQRIGQIAAGGRRARELTERVRELTERKEPGPAE